VHDAEIFVGVLGASSYSYAEATFTQTLPDWIGAHVRMFRFFGGVPRLVVPDNLKSGVHRASFYDPEINRSYGMMAAHRALGAVTYRRHRALLNCNPRVYYTLFWIHPCLRPCGVRVSPPAPWPAKTLSMAGAR
jgi:transposase